MIVNGVLIPVDPYRLLITLREELAKNNIYRFSKIYYRGSSNLVFNCPMHKEGQEKNPSCSLVLEDLPTIKAGMIKCFSCNYKADIFEMISNLFGKNDFGQFGKKWVSQNFNFEFVDDDSVLFSMELINSKIRNDQIINKVSGTVDYKIYSEEELNIYRYYHPYMFERKLTKKIISLYDVGYDSNFLFKNKVYECLTFPIHDMEGRVYSILRRSIYEKKFFIPKNFEKPVYGLYQLDSGPKIIYITESIINCLTLRGWGYNAVALMGLGSDTQIKILKKLDAFVFIIVFDGDASGMDGAYKLKKKLNNSVCTRIKHMKKNNDVNDITKEEFENLLETW